MHWHSQNLQTLQNSVNATSQSYFYTMKPFQVHYNANIPHVGQTQQINKPTSRSIYPSNNLAQYNDMAMTSNNIFHQYNQISDLTQKIEPGNIDKRQLSFYHFKFSIS